MSDYDEHAGVALCLGHFVSTMQWHDLSETLQYDAKRALVNFFGGTLGAARHPDITALAAVLETFSGPREATVIGRGERLDALSASTLNAVSANLLDYDDTHLPTVIHPAAPVAVVAHKRNPAGPQTLLDAAHIGCKYHISWAHIGCKWAHIWCKQLTNRDCSGETGLPPTGVYRIVRVLTIEPGGPHDVRSR
jgi:hypothetical protein